MSDWCAYKAWFSRNVVVIIQIDLENVKAVGFQPQLVYFIVKVEEQTLSTQVGNFFSFKNIYFIIIN